MRANPHRILFVEDNDLLRALVEEVLHAEGYELDSAATVAAAQSLLDGNCYDLMLTDGRLPDGDGFMLARQASAKDIKVLVYTAYGLEFSDKDRSSYPILAKPVRVSELLTVIRHFLGEDITRLPPRRAESVGLIEG